MFRTLRAVLAGAIAYYLTGLSVAFSVTLITAGVVKHGWPTQRFIESVLIKSMYGHVVNSVLCFVGGLMAGYVVTAVDKDHRLAMVWSITGIQVLDHVIRRHGRFVKPTPWILFWWALVAVGSWLGGKIYLARAFRHSVEPQLAGPPPIATP